MPLNEIDRLKRTVTDAWESPVADRVAAEWGHPAGTAKWWRSSAAHVFVLPDPDGKRYLRFTPESYRGAAMADPVADLMVRLSASGSAVVRPVPTAAGTLTATVHTELGRMRAMVVEAAPGESIDADDLTEERAAAWGRALAEVHRDAAGAKGLPESFTELAAVPERFAADRPLVEAAARIAARLAELPRDAAVFGAVHGDFELDNLAWDGDRATAFDFDEAADSWYAADIAGALRDLTGPDGRPDPGLRAMHDAFLAGYRTARPLTDAEVAALPLFAAAQAVGSLAAIDRALGAPGDDEAPWLVELRARLADLAASHRALAIAADL
ncbi:hypothetical protein GCM10009853_015790 [Glycomyces scopariae]